MYQLFRFGMVLVPRLPRWLTMNVLPPILGFIAWLVAAKARSQANANMLHVLGPDIVRTRAGHRQLRRTVRRMFQNNVRNYLGVFLLPTIPAQDFNHTIYITGKEHFDEALALGKGVILFSAHIGPFEYLVQWLAVNGYPITIPVEHLKDERMLDLMVSLRSSRGVQFLPLGDSSALRAMFSALRKNQSVLITADRTVQGESVEQIFFGAPARLPIGPAHLSARTGAPLVGAVGWQLAHGRIMGEFLPLSLTLPPEERKNAARLTQAIAERLEGVIGAHPEQWLMFAPIWREEN